MNLATDQVRVHRTLLVVLRETTVLTSRNFNVHSQGSQKTVSIQKKSKKRSKIEDNILEKVFLVISRRTTKTQYF